MLLAWRLGARACDLFIEGWVLTIVLIEVEQGLFHVDLQGFGGARFIVVAAAVTAALEVLGVAAWGVTPGKLLLGLRVQRVGGDAAGIGLGLAVLRWVVLYGAVLLPYVGWVFLAVNAAVTLSTGRGLHDRAALTTVVPVPDRQGGRTS